MEELPGLYFMRARYYSAEAGVFLSTDPVKKIGPGWKSVAYGYAEANPLKFSDADGEYAQSLLAIWALSAGKAALEQGVEDIAKEVGTGVGFSAETTELVVGLASSVRTLSGKINDGIDAYHAVASAQGSTAKLMATGGYLAAEFGDVSGKAIYKFSGKLMDGYLGALNKVGSTIGNQIGAALYERGPNGPNANSTPMTIGIPFQPNGGNQSLSGRTVTAATVVPAANGGSTRPSGSTSGGSTSPSGGTYTVRTGDTLGNIGYANGTTAAAIGVANGIQNLNLIRPGQVLTIPGRR